MRTSPSPVAVVLSAIALLAACAHNPRPATPAPPQAGAAATVDLSGQWNFVADVGGRQLVGVVQLTRSGASYSGTASASDAQGTAPLTSITVSGTHVVMTFDAPQGEARAEAVLADANTMNGTVAYAGLTGRFTARKL